MPLEARFSDAIQAGALQKRCDQILEIIHPPGPGFFVDDDEKGALKQEYNQLSHKIGDLKRGPLPDPLVFLPPEVWTDIIQQAADENSQNMSPTDVLLLLTLVSKQWSNKILDNPRLWTNITIGRGEADAQAKLGLALYLSGNLLLNLTIKIAPCQWEDNLSLLQAAVHRMKSILFGKSERSNAVIAGVPARFIDHFLASFEHLPSLKVIRTTHELLVNWADFFTKCPALSYIYGPTIPWKMLWNGPQIPIRACQIDASSRELIPRLDHFADLRELIWEPKPDTIINIKGGYGSVPALVTLRHHDSTDVRNTSLFRILKSTTTLTWLGITIWDWHYLYELFAHLNHLPHLLVFDLTLEDRLGKISLPTIQPTETNVQDLYFTSYPYGPGMPREDAQESLNQEAIFSVFHFYFPNVKRLHLAFCIFGRSVAAYIRSATYLWSLTMSQVEVLSLSLYDIVIKSTSLEFLEIVGFYIAWYFAVTADCPSLSRLTIDQTDSAEGPYMSNNQSVFNTVNHLHIKYGMAPLEVPRFNTLRKLRVGEASGDYSGSGVLIPLLCNTDIYPLLREVVLEFIPEWDILFLTLERRNYLPKSRGVARIETLVLPSPISPRLLAPLTEILSGRFTERPSNPELSFGSFMEAYFDPSISGCQACFRSMTSCSAELEKSLDDSFALGDILLPDSQPQISGETWEWLLGRDDRVLEWKGHLDAWEIYNLNRVESCTTMKFAQKPFIITGSSYGNASDW